MNSITYPAPVTGATSAATRLAGVLARVRHLAWEALSAVAGSRGRATLLALAREHEAARPGLAAQLRATARRGWL